MNNYPDNIIYALKNSIHRLKWYMETNDSRYLDESIDYLKVANIYMNELNKLKGCSNEV